MDDDDLRVCGKIFCQGEEVHLISRFEEDQILEIGPALFMIFSFFYIYILLAPSGALIAIPTYY